MKAFIVLSAVLAMAVAKPGLLSYPGYNAGYQVAAPVHYAAAPIQQYHAVAPVQQYHAVAPVQQYHAVPLHHPAGAIQYTAGPATFAKYVPAHYPAPQPGISSRYHAQTELGDSSFGYAHPGQAASEVRDASGNVAGEYSYVNPDGKEVRVTYTADAVNGFSAKSNLVDEVVQDTPEVVEARAAHLKLVEEANAASAAALEKALKEAAEKESAAKKA